jgi:hypothetical protein
MNKIKISRIKEISKMKKYCNLKPNLKLYKYMFN